MTGSLLYALAGAGLVGLGVYGLIAHAHGLRKLLAFNITGSGVFLVLVAVSRSGDSPADPVPQALVLTGIVVAVSATGFALALLRRLYNESGATTFDPDDT
jgi:multicomponent Na+:H+ antiporter subunit C